MEKYNKQNEISKDSNFFFPYEDLNMLERLRNCSIIPKGFSDFQIFVKNLIGDTISDDVIKDAWTNIYKNEALEEDSTNLSAASRSSSSSDYVSGIRNAINDVLSNDPEISQYSKENLKKKCSSQHISTTKSKKMRVRKKKFVRNLSSLVESCPGVSSEQNAKNQPNTVQNDVRDAVIACQPFDCISKKVKKGRCSSSSALRTTKRIKTSMSVNETDDYLNKSDEDISNTTSNSKKLIYNETLQNDNDSNISFAEQVELISTTKIGKKPLSAPFAMSSNQMQETSTKSNNEDVTSDEDEDSSSDCEIIEIVSLNNLNNNASDVSGNELNISGIKSEESDSDNSVEILESECNIKPITNNYEDTSCPIHGEKDYEVSPNSCESFCNQKKSNFLDLQLPVNHQAFSNSNYNLKNQKVEMKKRKNDKYKLLKSEVNCLKSLLVNLLVSLKDASINNSGTSSDSIPTLTTDLLDTVKENCGGSKKSFGSAFEGRKKISEEYGRKARSLPKSPQFMESNRSRKNKPRERKRPDLKNTKTCIDVPELLQKFEDTDSSTSENGKRKKFIWREIITDTLKCKPGRQMSVEKLKRLVIAKYYLCRGNVSQNTTVKFFRYLNSTAGIVVNGDMAVYSNKDFKSSSLSEQKNQYVLKTVTTTKEYKMSE